MAALELVNTGEQPDTDHVQATFGASVAHLDTEIIALRCKAAKRAFWTLLHDHCTRRLESLDAK
jgi:hypothetical protein